jgi:hypothetical protein
VFLSGVRRVVSVVVVLMLALMVLPVVSASAQVVSANPWADVSISKVADGTGHGTAAASFVNTGNGFFPGDDTAIDGVVSSGDTVEYSVTMNFKASTARTVTFTLNTGALLTWPTTGDLLCKNGFFVQATRSGNVCSFTVPAGAVESITAPVVLLAKDSGGLAVANQVFSIGVGTSGGGDRIFYGCCSGGDGGIGPSI